jgi:hypothetical protein
MHLLDIAPFLAFGAAVLAAELIARFSYQPPHTVQPRPDRLQAQHPGTDVPVAPDQRGHLEQVASFLPQRQRVELAFGRDSRLARHRRVGPEQA